MTRLINCSLVLVLCGCGSPEGAQEEVETAVLNNKVANRSPSADPSTNENDDELNHIASPDLPAAVGNEISPGDFALTSPSSPLANVEQIVLTVSNLLVGDTIRLYNDSGCSNLLHSVTAASDRVDISYDIGDAGQYEFYARKVNSAGLGPCSSESVSYTLDNSVSSITDINLLAPAQSPANNASPTLAVLGVSEGDQISIYTSSDCSGLVASSPAAAGGHTEVTLVDGALIVEASYQFFGRVSDNAGNTSECSDTFLSYTLDQSAPSAPASLSLVSDLSPSTNASPHINVGGVEVGAVVEIFLNAACSGVAAASVTALHTDVDISLPALTRFGEYTLYASQVDKANNRSDCSAASLDYEYIENPQPPTISLTHWLAADDVSVDGSGKVQAVHDKSSLSFGLSQAEESYQPIVSASGPNGLPMLVFDGVNDHLAASGSAFNVKYILAAYRVSAAAMNSGHLGQVWGQYHSLGHLACDARSNKERSFSFDGASTSGTAGKYWLDDEADFSPNYYSSSPQLLWAYDEIEVTTVELNLQRAMDTITMGHLAGTFSVGNHHFGGEVGEVLIYDATASAQTIADARAYLKNKWLP